MPRALRSEQYDRTEVCIVHAVQRCVRRAFLTGQDAVSGKNYEFRREWIRCRMEQLASVFAIDVLTYAILSNHMHIVLRNRPDIVKTWSDYDVALRWLRVFPGRRIDEHLAEPTTNDVETLVKDTERLAEIRLRMADPSWFMRALSEPIARLANRQDNQTGCFWEGRFKAHAIVDEAGLLACSMYVDLNPIRAAMALTPEESLHTSAYDRIAALKGKTIPSAAAELVAIETEEAGRILRTSTPDQLRKRRADARKKRGQPILRDAWLAPLTINERGQLGPQPSKSNIRASDKGFLGMDPSEYITLLDWTGRQHPLAPKAAIPKNLAPILQRIGIDGNMWVDLVWNFKKYFGKGSGIGKPSSLRKYAESHERKYSRGQRSAASCFTDN